MEDHARTDLAKPIAAPPFVNDTATSQSGDEIGSLRSRLARRGEEVWPKGENPFCQAASVTRTRIAQKNCDVAAPVKSRFLPNRAGDCRFFDLNTRVLVGKNN